MYIRNCHSNASCLATRNFSFRPRERVFSFIYFLLAFTEFFVRVFFFFVQYIRSCAAFCFSIFVRVDSTNFGRSSLHIKLQLCWIFFFYFKTTNFLRKAHFLTKFPVKSAFYHINVFISAKRKRKEKNQFKSRDWLCYSRI